ncbi:copper amine oxidase N-terminal domain-containing protein [Paenibacillus sp. GYB004]|uniref:copper amine oxidase N-terminal domain-containing protein n=1 Tax=Paenibacillus sp. GYB004 TaxID=2994393 RepID=UPI002F96AD5B
MKKLTTILASAFFATAFFANVSFASDLNMRVEGQPVQFQYGSPFIDNGSSLVPLRDLLVSLGVSNDDKSIVWNGDEQSVTAIKGDKTVKLSVGAKAIFLNGEMYRELDVPAQNVDGRVYLPARAVAEAFGYFVDFDGNTRTILVQEVPFGGGVKADDFVDPVVAGKSLANIETALNAFAGFSLPAASKDALERNAAAFFAPDRSPLSLDELDTYVSESDLAKNPAKYAGDILAYSSVTLDTVREMEIDNGEVVTGAVGHTGGTYSQLLEKWQDSTYFQIFYAGSTDVSKGDKATVKGIVVGETTIELTNAQGARFVQPMYVMVAGNLLTTGAEYDYRMERSRQNPGEIVIPELDNQPTHAQKALNQLSVNLKGGKLEIIDELSSDLEILELKIMDYAYKLSKPIRIPSKYDGGLAIELSAFVDGKGNAFVPQSGEGYFIKVATNAGEIARFESHDPNSQSKADERVLQALNDLLGGAKFDSGKLVLEFPTTQTFKIQKVTIDSSYTYTPAKPIDVSPASPKVEIPLSEVRNAFGQAFVPKKEGQWSLTHGVTISTNYGDVKKSASDETKSTTPACPNCQQQVGGGSLSPTSGTSDSNTRLNTADPNPFVTKDQVDDSGSRLNATDPSNFLREDQPDDAASRLNVAFPD